MSAKRKILIMLSMVAMACFAGGCSEFIKNGVVSRESNSESSIVDDEAEQPFATVTAAYGKTYDLLWLPEIGAAAYYDIEVVSPSGKNVNLSDSILLLDELGGWTICYGDRCWRLLSKDKTAPVVTLTEEFTTVYYGDTVSLPKFNITDNCDEDISQYSYQFFFGEEMVAENTSFVIKKAGEYTLCISGSDSSGNEFVFNHPFTVIYPAPLKFKYSYEKERVVSQGTLISLNTSFLGVSVSSAKRYAISYEVYKNGKAIEDTQFIVGKGEYYDVYVQATDPDTKEVSSMYILYRTSDCLLISYENEELENAPQGNYICNVYGAPSNSANNETRDTVDIGGGKYAFQFKANSGKVVCMWPATGVPLGKYEIRINFVLAEGTTNLNLKVGDSTVAMYSNENGAQANEKWQAVLSDMEVYSLEGNRYGFDLVTDNGTVITIESVQFVPCS